MSGGQRPERKGDQESVPPRPGGGAETKSGGSADVIQVGAALACLAFGHAFIFWDARPLSDYYFIVIWGGYILLVDYLAYRRASRSLLRTYPRTFLALWPLSAAFWWLFELYNEFVRNWRYLGPEEYQGLLYFAIGSLFFSTVLPAVFGTADLLLTFSRSARPLVPVIGRFAEAVNRDASDKTAEGGPAATPSLDQAPPPPPVSPSPLPAISPSPLPPSLPLLGVLLALLPLVQPEYFFPLVWVGLFVVIDPLNARAGRPSILAMLWGRQWRVPAALYVGTTITGFFWELWNYWAFPKWVYTLPEPVERFPYLFEMPLPGYLGYGPFGWELFAMWWLCWGLWEWGASLARQQPGLHCPRAEWSAEGD